MYIMDRYFFIHNSGLLWSLMFIIYLHIYFSDGKSSYLPEETFLIYTLEHIAQSDGYENVIINFYSLY